MSNVRIKKKIVFVCLIFYSSSGHVVAQFVEALWYKPEGCGFDSL